MTRSYQEPEKGLNPALEAWSQASLREVLLPSGTWVRIRLTPIEQLVKRDLLPDDLTGIALRMATEGVNTRGMDAEGFGSFLRLVDEIVCQMIRAVKVGEEWTPVTLKPGDLAEFDFPGDDIEQLGLIAIRKTSAEKVTLDSKIARGLVEVSDIAQARKEARMSDDSTEGLAGFREDRDLPPDSSGGPDVRDEAVDARRDSRPGRRARLRSRGASPTQ